jgi:hypothetical protein
MLPSLKSRRDFAISSCISVITLQTPTNQGCQKLFRFGQPKIGSHLRIQREESLAGYSLFRKGESCGRGSEHLLHQQNRPSPLDFASYFPMQVCRHSGDAAWQNFATFSHKFFEQVRILVVDGFCGNIDASTRHNPVGPSEVRSAFGGFRFHYLLHLPMKGASAQKRIVLFLLQTARCIQAFFVARADVTGNRFTFRLRLRAL